LRRLKLSLRITMQMRDRIGHGYKIWESSMEPVAFVGSPEPGVTP